MKSLVTRHSSLVTHHSSLITHHSSFIIHHSTSTLPPKLAVALLTTAPPTKPRSPPPNTPPGPKSPPSSSTSPKPSRGGNPPRPSISPFSLSRRAFLGKTANGLGHIALSSLLLRDLRAANATSGDLPPTLRTIAPKAKRVIWLFQSGGPSHVDLFDGKPALDRLHGSELPDSVRGGQRVTGMTSGQSSFPVVRPIAPGSPCGPADVWISDLLPSQYQGVMLRAGAEPVLYLENPSGVSRERRRHLLDGLAELNHHIATETGDPETTARIHAYEMAFRMQASVPDLTDLSGESAATYDLYGPESRPPGTYAANCLLARRLAERGVRFIQLFHRGWDQHIAITRQLPNQCRDTDQASAALVLDLKQRGLHEDTLVVWGGEFGRTVYSQGSPNSAVAGRDHHGRCFSVWLAGAGVKPGSVLGETDDFAWNITRDPHRIRDLHATILHQLGLDHNRFTFPFRGLDQRLTGVEPAHVIRKILG